MFKIGEFSQFTRVSVKMLRHYDDLGLLKPAQVDRWTGYRYYSADQLPRLNRILVLKELGFPLEQIATLLTDDLSLAQLAGMLKLRRAEVEASVRTEQQRLAQIEARLSLLTQTPQHLAYEVIVRPVPAQRMATLRQRVANLDEAVAALFDELECYVAAHKARAFSSPVLLYHDAEYREAECDVEAAIPISHDLPDNDRITIRELPAADAMACVVYTGDYAKLPDVLHALLLWLDAHHYQIAGPLREVYLRFGANQAQVLNLPSAFLADHHHLYVTEVQVPIEHRGEIERYRERYRD